MTVEFAVSKVAPAQNRLEESTVLESISHLLTPAKVENRRDLPKPNAKMLGIEACSDTQHPVIAGVPFHPLYAAAYRAFMDHRPLTLSPDMIWLAIAQGVAQHINNNAEVLRKTFVQHQGKAKIVVRRDDFVKGGVNPWPEAFEAFSLGILEHVGAETHRKFVAQFSTTGPAEKAANEIVLMDSMKAYFELVLMTRCGIPSITLEGTVDDWKLLEQKVQELSAIIPGWWMKHLQPICSHFVKAASGSADPTHWQNIYKWKSQSGDDSNDGWLTYLLPYVKDHSGAVTKINPFGSGGFYTGISTSDIPSGLSACPFKWDYLGHIFEMKFLAGFVAATQDPQDLAVRPLIGWAVQDVSAISSKSAPSTWPR